MDRVIFACVHNAGRSQMAAAFFHQLATRAHALSAGTNPGPHVHPVVAEVMREVGLDLSKAQPQQLTPELAANASWLVTMGCGDHCPVARGTHVEDWPLPDPKNQPVERVREIRDEVKARVQALITAQGW